MAAIHKTFILAAIFTIAVSLNAHVENIINAHPDYTVLCMGPECTLGSLATLQKAAIESQKESTLTEIIEFGMKMLEEVKRLATGLNHIYIAETKRNPKRDVPRIKVSYCKDFDAKTNMYTETSKIRLYSHCGGDFELDAYEKKETYVSFEKHSLSKTTS